MTAGRQYHTEQTHYVSAELEFSDFPTSGSTKVIGVIPAGSIIIGSGAMVQTKFAPTAGSQPLFVVGTQIAGQSARFCLSTDIGMATVAFSALTRGNGVASQDLVITAQLSTGAMAAFPTTGKLQYFLQYVPPNDNKQDRSTFN